MTGRQAELLDTRAFGGDPTKRHAYVPALPERVDAEAADGTELVGEVHLDAGLRAASR